MRTSSCASTFDAMGIPLRISISLPVQQTPTMLNRSAPAFFATSVISRATSTMRSLRSGLCPWTATLTLFSSRTPRFTSLSTSLGVPNSTSLRSEDICAPV